MKIDLHVHTSERSPCGRSKTEGMITAAKSYGLGGIAITDHNVMVPPEMLEELRREHAPFKIFTGIEIGIGNEHLLVLGIADPELGEREWAYPALHRFVREREGYLILAHPYRFTSGVNIDVDSFPPDAVEVHSGNTGADSEGIIIELARRLDCSLVYTSDSHHLADVGLFHLEFGLNIEDDRALLAALREGDFVPSCREERLAQINSEIDRRERMIRQMIADGKSAKDYVAETGGWDGQFNRVAMGKSYRL